MNPRTIVLDPGFLKEIEPREGNNETFVIRLSVFDVPQEVAAEEGKGGVLHIRFFYPDEEKGVTDSSDEGMTLVTGRYSGKILGIDVKGNGRDADRIDAAVERLRQRGEKLRRPNQRLNHQLIETVLRRKGRELLTVPEPS